MIIELNGSNVYQNHEFEAHKNLSHKQFQVKVYYFMDYAVVYTVDRRFS